MTHAPASGFCFRAARRVDADAGDRAKSSHGERSRCKHGAVAGARVRALPTPAGLAELPVEMGRPRYPQHETNSIPALQAAVPDRRRTILQFSNPLCRLWGLFLSFLPS
ncbi:hypothetical protein GCM10017083_51080 [Thalassobaculum fulvum]|uniref:Uncharacterized protein n=1 Tax=Thalassobaculum fulvum TaxID=1633335 RepID=A0A918XXW9_9PROT|nr:hypothetical protein GCM10017083_51080 [Thalassobaculum fulvum]